jgi:molybdenum cofactor biosynthesis protein B
MNSPQQHRTEARAIAARVAVVTFSDTRTSESDTSGKVISDTLDATGHQVIARHLIPENPDDIRNILDGLIGRDDLDAIITNGGTGIARRDNTVSIVSALIDTPLPGFGELFRMLSWEQVGPAAMISRALAGVARGKLLFALPGSTPAVELAMTRLIVPELAHLLRELRK